MVMRSPDPIGRGTEGKTKIDEKQAITHTASSISVGGAVEATRGGVTLDRSSSALVRDQLDHPVIDADGHVIEFMPLVDDYIREEGGTDLAHVFSNDFSPRSREAKWYQATKQDREYHRMVRTPWWPIPSRLTVDNATSVLPDLLAARMEEMGLDFAILYPTFGFGALHVTNDEFRVPLCRAFNRYIADTFGAYPERMTPVAMVPMQTPDEAIAELEYAVQNCGFKAVVLASYARRPIPALQAKCGDLGPYGVYLDFFGIDSPYDYDPVWQKCMDLKVAPAFHSGGTGTGTRMSISKYVFNHMGHFASAAEGLCKSLFLGGVPQRFPALRFAFLEAGVGWAVNLLGDLIGHWEKRNKGAITNYDPSNFDREQFLQFFLLHAPASMKKYVDHIDSIVYQMGERYDGSETDEFSDIGCDSPEEIATRFLTSFAFGCEADDPINAWAFESHVDPLNRDFRAVFSSDIGHWDVPDMSEVLKEAYELVDRGSIDREQFRKFVCSNIVDTLTSVNPAFFEGTSVEGVVAAE